MTRDNAQDKPKHETETPAGPAKQAPQTATTEAKLQAADKPQAADEIVFYEGTISKVVFDDDGKPNIVMSDHVAPGEKLKRVYDEEQAAEKLKASEDKAAKDAK